MQQFEKNAIVSYLLQTHNLDYILDIPVIPLVSGRTASLRVRGSFYRTHVLLHGPDDELFGTLDPDAVRLHSLPVAASKLLVDQGEVHLNVKILDLVQAIAYVQLARQHLALRDAPGYAWSWDKTRQWLALFWEWISTCTFSQGLFTSLKSFPFLPTTAGELRSVTEDVFLYPTHLTDRQRSVLSLVGVHLLDSSIPSSFLESCRPKVMKNVDIANDLLDVLQTTLLAPTDVDAAEVLRAHLANSMSGVRLSKARSDILRALPIHPILALDSVTLSTAITLNGIPPNCTIRCIPVLPSLSIPLPQLDNSVFVDCTPDEQRLIQQIDYTAAMNPVVEGDLIHLHMQYFAQQTSPTRLRVLCRLASHPPFCTPEIVEKLRSSPIILVGSGVRSLAPRDVVDPSSALAGLVPPGDEYSIFEGSEINLEITKALSQMGFLRRELDAHFVTERIRCIGAQSTSAIAEETARALLSMLEKTHFSCAHVQYDPELSWIPTDKGLQRPRDCRDTSAAALCDRVLALFTAFRLKSHSLRKLLGWIIPIPMHILVDQFLRILSEPDGTVAPEYYVDITSEFGQRWPELQASSELVSLVEHARSKAWVLVEGGTTMQPACAVFELPTRLRGFGRVSLDVVRRPGVKEFLLHMGCAERFVPSIHLMPTL